LNKDENMEKDLLLLPQPQKMEIAEGTYQLVNNQLILLQGPDLAGLCFAARRFQAVLVEQTGLTWEIVASPSVPRTPIGLHLKISPDEIQCLQGYELLITSERITITAHDNAGAFYAVCTLSQIIGQATTELPIMKISDWPDFPVRGVMLDVSRDKVPTMQTVFSLVDMLAAWKINQLQLYTEHTFAYRNHPVVWAQASPFTGQEIMALDEYCRQRHIELVPNQNSLGHMHRWLIHPRYAPLAEVREGYQAPWGYVEGPYSLCPTDPSSLDLVRSLYDELLPHFSSQMVNVGCDEIFDLGQGRSQAVVEERGADQVYLEYLLEIYKDLKSRQYTMQFWGDMVIHEPGLIPDLPKDVILLEWGYEAQHPFIENCSRFAQAGLSFYVCPGTSSWNSIAGRTHNALGNLQNAASSGIQLGASGYMITDWGDNGHWQPLPVSYLGFAAGAAYAWAWEANSELDISRAISLHAFQDPTGSMGQVAYDLGNVYRSLGLDLPNSTPLFWILRWPLEQLAGYASLAPEGLQQALDVIQRAQELLPKARMKRSDRSLIIQEYELVIRLLQHACQRIKLVSIQDTVEAVDLRHELYEDLQEILGLFTYVWLERNRPGGLADSRKGLEKLLDDYLVDIQH
jgi:hexosaminidase